LAHFSLKKFFQGPRAQEIQAAAANGKLTDSVHSFGPLVNLRGGPLIVTPIGEMMTADEVAEYLQVNRTRIYRLLKRKELPGFKVGTDFRLRRVDVDDWIVKKEQTAWMHRARL
jgi:excisionase family DNA binding protein